MVRSERPGCDVHGVILITGIMAAGKSTVAQALAERLPRSVHLRGDLFRRMIVNGRAEMGFPLSAEAERQLSLRYQMAATTAAAYHRTGFAVVYQDIIIGRGLAASLTPATFRWRMRDVARLLEDGLVPALNSRLGAPLRLLNIGGGPALDSLSALIVLQKEHHDLLDGRAIAVHVLDIDAAGPSFGARSLAALQTDEGPLFGAGATLAHHTCDWTHPTELRRLLDQLMGEGAVLAASTEGALFEYPADEVIVENLQTLHEGTPADMVVVGPVIRDASTLDPRLTSSEHIPGRPAIRYPGLAHFDSLARQAGWTIARHLDGPMHQVVSLAKL